MNVVSPSSAHNSQDDFLKHLQFSNIITPESKMRAVSALATSHQPFDVVVTELGLISDDGLSRCLNDFFNCPVVPHEPLTSNNDLVEQIGIEFLTEHALLPLKVEGVIDDLGESVFALANPLAGHVLETVEFLLEQPIQFTVLPRRKVLATLNAIREQSALVPIVDVLEEGTELGADDMDRLQDIASEAPVVRFVMEAVESAVARKATDIHIEPLQDKVVVRCRIDGLLHIVADAPKSLHAGIATRIKVLSRLNIAEQRRPQDGRMRVPVRGKNVDLRVSFLPSINGETIVMRILDKSTVPLDLEKLGFERKARAKLTKLASAANGIVLITGPTGSGKTTTLYSMIEMIKRPELKIFTIENPVEYKLDDVVQIQVNAAIGFSFPEALRSVLRQDPDIILLGEIRDRETADIAIKASLTGHLVFSTLHTNSASEAITRLRDMGIEPYLIAATLRGVVAQRLLRSCCPNCRLKGEDESTCTQCNGSGFSGRTVCYEILMGSKEFSESISSGLSSGDLENQAKHFGMVGLQDHARSLIAANKTTHAETARVLETGSG